MKIISHTPKAKSEHALDTSSMTLTLTCQSGLESLIRREAEKLGLEETTGQDRLVSGKGDLATLYRLLMGSRFASRAYIEILVGKITDFDTLHDHLTKIPWTEYLTGREHIVIEAASTRSALSSLPTIQSVAQKAIFSTLYTPNNANAIEIHILILIVDDTARILLDVTGDPLHKRGYRVESGEAPIKESLWAALVAFSGWRFREAFLDPFCGSGTIAIEAAMIARNIPPGIGRHFRIENLSFHDRDLMMSTREAMRGKIYPSGSYQIFASDIDSNMIEIARRNAEKAWVGDDIVFSVGNFLEDPERVATIVTNPPYGKRLETGEDLHELYTKLIHSIEKNGGGFITSYPVDVRYGLANRKLLNGRDECRFWYKKNEK